MARVTVADLPVCPRCGDRNWVRLGSRPTEIRRIAVDTAGEPLTFLDHGPSAEIRGLSARWECAVCVLGTDVATSLRLDSLRRRLARAA